MIKVDHQGREVSIRGPIDEVLSDTMVVLERICSIAFKNDEIGSDVLKDAIRGAVEQAFVYAEQDEEETDDECSSIRP